MNIRILEAPKTICSNPHGMHRYFAWPSVTRLQDGSLAAVASGFRLAHVCPFGKVVLFRSYDEGRSWTAPEVILDTPLDDRDGGICTFGESGVVVTSFNNDPSFQRRFAKDSPYRTAYLDAVEATENCRDYLGSTMVISRDGGKTFGDPILCPISSPHGPCTLLDGTVLYVGRRFHDDGSQPHLECRVLHPDGSTSLRSRIADVGEHLLSCEPHAIQLPSGRIVVHIRVQDDQKKHFTVYQSVSDDLGYTFTAPVPLLADKGGSPPHLLLHSSGVLVSVYGYREKPYGIRAMFSRDGGETWDTDNVLLSEEPSADLGYPASVELLYGRILTVFYTRERAGGDSVIRQVVWSFTP